MWNVRNQCISAGWIVQTLEIPIFYENPDDAEAECEFLPRSLPKSDPSEGDRKVSSGRFEAFGGSQRATPVFLVIEWRHAARPTGSAAQAARFSGAADLPATVLAERLPRPDHRADSELQLRTVRRRTACQAVRFWAGV